MYLWFGFAKLKHCLADVFCLSPMFSIRIWLKVLADDKLSERLSSINTQVKAWCCFGPLNQSLWFFSVCLFSKSHLLAWSPLFFSSHPFPHPSCLLSASLGGHLWWDKASILEPTGEPNTQAHEREHTYINIHVRVQNCNQFLHWPRKRVGQTLKKHHGDGGRKAPASFNVEIKAPRMERWRHEKP